MELAIIMYERFCIPSDFARIRFPSPNLNRPRSERVARLGVPADKPGEHHRCWHREERVRIKVVQVPRRLDAEVHVEAVRATVLPADPVARPPFQVLARAQSAVRQHHADPAPFTQI